MDHPTSLFTGLKVVDCATWIAAPVAATILADLGADVVKIEIPGQGDPYRGLAEAPGTPNADFNYTWTMDARNKRSLALNLKTEDGRQVLHKLVAECDVYITNQPLPMRRALGLTFEDLKPLNPTMIFASLTAYGEHGPERDREGFDGVAYWARSGLQDLVRSVGATPGQSAPGMGDHPTGVALFAAIVTALYRRQQTGEGSMVHTSLLANGYWANGCLGSAALAGGDFTARRQPNDRAAAVFTRLLYETADGRYLQFNMVRSAEDQERLLQTAGLGDMLTDPRFASAEGRLEHGIEIANRLRAVFATATLDEWQQRFAASGVPASHVAIVEDMRDDEQARLNNVLVQPTDPGVPTDWIINHPINIDGVTQIGPTRAPDVGEHSSEVLRELGYDDATIESMRAGGVIDPLPAQNE